MNYNDIAIFIRIVKLIYISIYILYSKFIIENYNQTLMNLKENDF